jgi:hypothetical protein
MLDLKMLGLKGKGLYPSRANSTAELGSQRLESSN